MINDEFAAAGGYVCSVGITAMVFDPLLVTDGTVQLDDPVELSGSLRITDIAPGGGDPVSYTHLVPSKAFHSWAFPLARKKQSVPGSTFITM